MWRHEYIQLPQNQRLFVFEVKRGGTENVDDLGDICVDDIKVEAEECREFFALLQSCILRVTITRHY